MTKACTPRCPPRPNATPLPWSPTAPGRQLNGVNNCTRELGFNPVDVLTGGCGAPTAVGGVAVWAPRRPAAPQVTFAPIAVALHTARPGTALGGIRSTTVTLLVR